MSVKMLHIVGLGATLVRVERDAFPKVETKRDLN